MKIRYYSDTHLEFGLPYPELEKNIGEDVVVLAGDIHVGTKGIEWARKALADRRVIYVIGNHEMYGGHWIRTIDECREAAADSNVSFLENDQVTIDGVTFLGAALWTDFDGWKNGSATTSIAAARRQMNDFRVIESGGGPGDFRRPLRPEETIERHHASAEWLSAAIEAATTPIVVVTHHGPTMEACQEKYRGDVLTPAFLSNRHDLIDPRIKAWIFGHTHHCCRLVINGVPVVSNQRGYPMEPHPGYDPNAMIEVASVP